MELPQKIELIILDMDGLMFDSEKISYESWVRAAKLHGYTVSEELFYKTIGTNMDKTRMIYEEYFDQSFPMEKVIQDRKRISEEIIDIKGIPIKNGLFELLDYLKNKDEKLAVATSASRDRAVKFLTMSGVVDYFDCIVCGDEVKESKPHPEIFLRACENLSCKPSSTIVLEDSMAGIEAAFKGGMIPIMILDIVQPTKETLNKVFMVCDDLKGVITIVENLSKELR